MEMVKSHKFLTVVIASLLILMSGTIIGCIEEEEEDTLIIAQSAEPSVLNPVSHVDIYARYALMQIYDPLIQVYPDGEPNTDGRAVAESYEVSDDGLVYTFEIEEGLEFHNGDELTAHDVEFTFAAIDGTAEDKYDIDASPTSAQEGYMDHVDYVEAVDDYTVEVHMEEVYAEFLHTELMSTLYIIPKDYTIENGWDSLEDELIGSGPYEFEDYSAGDELVLEEFEDYRPEIDINIPRIVIDYYDDISPAVSALRAGEAHAIPHIDMSNYHDLQEEEEVINEWYEHPGHYRISFNHREGPFTDVRVRKAFAYAIDGPEVIDALRKELAGNTRALFPPGHDAYPEDGMKLFEQDVEKAQSLLEDAGYPDGLETELWVSEGDPVTEMAVVQEQVAESGFDVELQVVEWGTLLDEAEAGNQPMNFHGLTGGIAGIDVMEYYMGESWLSNFYDNPEVNEVVREAVRTVDYDERMELYAEAQKIAIEEDMACYVVGSRRQPLVYHESVTVPEDSLNPYMEDGPTYGWHLWEIEE